MRGSLKYIPAGSKYGRLTVIAEIFPRTNPRKFKCLCDCGNEKIAAVDRGHTRSCGCLNVDVHRELGFKHGRSRTNTYRIWALMLQRCENPDNPGYKNYGGRGITVCEAWHHFPNFLADMGERPPRLEIDRLDNDGHYCKENCAWRTRKAQMSNTRNTVRLTLHGETLSIAEWSEKLGIPHKVIAHRLERKWSIERALTAIYVPRK